MCSIFGYNQQGASILSLFFSSMKHRGPDEDGYYETKDWIFGHQRLAIIDTSSLANQPNGVMQDLFGKCLLYP